MTAWQCANHTIRDKNVECDPCSSQSENQLGKHLQANITDLLGIQMRNVTPTNRSFFLRPSLFWATPDKCQDRCSRCLSSFINRLKYYTWISLKMFKCLHMCTNYTLFRCLTQNWFFSNCFTSKAKVSEVWMPLKYIKKHFEYQLYKICLINNQTYISFIPNPLLCIEIPKPPWGLMTKYF